MSTYVGFVSVSSQLRLTCLSVSIFKTTHNFPLDFCILAENHANEIRKSAYADYSDYNELDCLLCLTSYILAHNDESGDGGNWYI